MLTKLLKKFKLCNHDQLAEDCKELNFKISEFYTVLYDASKSDKERAIKALDCLKQFNLIYERYSAEVYEAVYFSHYEELNKIRKQTCWPLIPN